MICDLTHIKDDHDVIHFDNSSDLSLSTSLNDLDFATLNIDGQSMDVDAPPDIIDVDEYDDFIDDEEILPYDLENFDDEVLASDDDDDDDDLKIQLTSAASIGATTRVGFISNSRILHYFIDEDDDFIDDEEILPHDLANFDEEVLANDDDDDVAVVYSNVSRYSTCHGGDSGSDAEPDGTRDVEGIRSRPPPNIKQLNWDKQIDYWLDAKNATRAFQNAPGKEQGLLPIGIPITCCHPRYAGGDAEAQGFRHQFADMHALHRGLDNGHNSSGYILDVGRVLVGRGRGVISINEPRCTHTDADVDEVKEENKKLKKELNMLMTVVRSDDRTSQLLMQLQSQHEVSSGSRSGGGEDDESGEDEDPEEDEDADESPGS
nr:hypothetical protein [Tanacetum cinerariifolium]